MEILNHANERLILPSFLFEPFERSSYIRLPELILVTPVEPGQCPYALATGRLWPPSPRWAWLAGPKGGILSSPQNFNLVCLGCFAVGAEEPKPRLNMRDKRPANRLSLARVSNEATANRHCPFLSMNQGFSPLQGQAATKQWCYPELWKSSCLDVLFGTLNGWGRQQRGPEFFCLFTWLYVHFVLGSGPKPNIHRNYIMFECSFNIRLWNVALWQKEKHRC